MGNILHSKGIVKVYFSPRFRRGELKYPLLYYKQSARAERDRNTSQLVDLSDNTISCSVGNLLDQPRIVKGHIFYMYTIYSGIRFSAPRGSIPWGVTVINKYHGDPGYLLYGYLLGKEVILKLPRVFDRGKYLNNSRYQYRHYCSGSPESGKSDRKDK